MHRSREPPAAAKIRALPIGSTNQIHDYHAARGEDTCRFHCCPSPGKTLTAASTSPSRPPSPPLDLGSAALVEIVRAFHHRSNATIRFGEQHTLSGRTAFPSRPLDAAETLHPLISSCPPFPPDLPLPRWQPAPLHGPAQRPAWQEEVTNKRRAFFA